MDGEDSTSLQRFLNTFRMGVVQDTHPSPITFSLSPVQALSNLELHSFPQVSVKSEAWLEMKLLSTEMSSLQSSALTSLLSCSMMEVSVFEYQPRHLLLSDILSISLLVFFEKVNFKKCLKYMG